MILFLDIETAPEYETFDLLPEAGKAAFTKKFNCRVLSGEYPDLAAVYEKEASLYAEFSKIICLGAGTEIMDKEKGDYFFVRGLIGEERHILLHLFEIIDRVKPTHICAHNGKCFDFPFIARRCIINKLPIPTMLNTGTKKPWEVPLIDTNEMWRFTDLKHYVSLITLCYILDIPSPKDDLDGTQIMATFYRGEIEKIKQYCMRDVIALYQIYFRLQGLPSVNKFQQV